MKTGFYAKLAWTGMRKNRRMYLPYGLTCVGMVMMYYIICFLATTPVLGQMRGGDTCQQMLGFGSWVMAVFAVIFLFYTNSFLLRRRKKEFGLYNILGMGKGNIARILIWETLLMAVLSLLVGLFLGLAFSKFAELAMVNMMNGQVQYSYSVSLPAMGRTVGLFGGIFLLLLVNGLMQIRISNPAALLRSESVGEKPPRANWFWGLLGAVMLAAAYYLALSIQEPLSALVWFFVAVVLVILATYLLFVAGSVLLCRILQKNKRYYYRANHFVSVSCMAFRMKRNGAGLASICILGTMVLVMLSASACLYFGAEDSLHTRYPRDITVELKLQELENFSDDSIDALRERVLENAGPGSREHIIDYRAVITSGLLVDGVLETDSEVLYEFGITSYDALYNICLIPLADYNHMAQQQVSLAPGQTMLYINRGNYPYDSLTLPGGQKLTITERLDEFWVPGTQTLDVVPTLFIVVPDLETVVAPLMQLSDSRGNQVMRLVWNYGFDTDASTQLQINAAGQIRDALREASIQGKIESYTCESMEANRGDFYGTFGGLFFLGILLSVVFILAAVLIIYYKQISEGYEDQARFEIMQKVGMTRRDIRRSINSQMLTVFLLPFVTAVIHLAFAFPMIRKLLMLFNLMNLPLLLATTGISVLVFGVFYALVYRITSNAYFSIVSGGQKE